VAVEGDATRDEAMNSEPLEDWQLGPRWLLMRTWAWTRDSYTL
jgi:hypothetical protein